MTTAAKEFSHRPYIDTEETIVLGRLHTDTLFCAILITADLVQSKHI